MSTNDKHNAPDKDDVQSLDALYQRARDLYTTEGYRAFLDFIARLPQYAPFNCALLHIQRPGASYFATQTQWKRDLGRHVEAGARPCVILHPFGPVLFVFAAEDTLPGEDGRELPEHVTNPFAVEGDLSPAVWQRTCAHCDEQERVKIQFDPRLAQGHGGSIAPNGPRFKVPARHTDVITLQGYDPTQHGATQGAGATGPDSVSIEEQYGTVAHELAHLFCGHLGATDGDWWPHRMRLSKAQKEIEAESVAYLVCRRAGLHSISERYLQWHILRAEAGEGNASQNDSSHSTLLSEVSLDVILKAAGYIERMGQTGFSSKRDFSG